MSSCEICPRGCASRPGFCKADAVPTIARADLHMWEEPPISGKSGAGAVFFSGCNLRCVFCQNGDISANLKGEPCSVERLCEIFFELQERGAHNIDLVTPTPHAKAATAAMEKARALGLRIPFVWNSNAYESVEMLKRLDGIVDVYLPDMKYASSERAAKYSGAADYPTVAMKAIKEMWRQRGELKMDATGIAVSGVLIRHLLLPGCADDTRRVLDFVADEFGTAASLSLMRQYTPMHKVAQRPRDYPFLTRRITNREYERAVEYAYVKGLTDVYIQKRSSADKKYTPTFDGTGC